MHPLILKSSLGCPVAAAAAAAAATAANGDGDRDDHDKNGAVCTLQASLTGNTFSAFPCSLTWRRPS